MGKKDWGVVGPSGEVTAWGGEEEEEDKEDGKEKSGIKG